MAEQKKPNTTTDDPGPSWNVTTQVINQPPVEINSPLCFSPKLGDLFTALSALHGELATVERDDEATIKSDRANYSYKFTTLGAFRKTINPLLAKHGLSLTQHGVGTALMTCLGHSSGQFIMTSFDLKPMVPEEGVDPRGLGGLLTYCCRYMALPAVGIAPAADDDAKDLPKGPSTTSGQAIGQDWSGGLPRAAAMGAAVTQGGGPTGRVVGTCVTGVIKGTTVKGQPMWNVSFSDGMACKCFHQNMGARAEEMAKTGESVVREVVMGGDQGQFRNLERLDYVTDDHPVPADQSGVATATGGGAADPSGSDSIEPFNWSNRVKAKEVLVQACVNRGMHPDRITRVFSDYASFLDIENLTVAMPADLKTLHEQILGGDHDEPSF